MAMIEEQDGRVGDEAELAPKELVLKWLETGASTTEGRSMAEDAALHGDDMRYLKAPALALCADYDEHKGGEANTHFMITEGDTVVWEFDASFVGHDGEQYTNQYSISAKVRDGEIANLREHADTLHNYKLLMGTPANLLAVMDRLGKHRAELAA